MGLSIEIEMMILLGNGHLMLRVTIQIIQELYWVASTCSCSFCDVCIRFSLNSGEYEFI